MYRIKAPSESYERKIGGIRFVKGVAETDDAWLASWFSGRPGFTVEPVPVNEPEDEQAGEPAEGTEKKPAVQDKKPAGKRGKQDDKGKADGAGEKPAADGAGADA